ESSSDRGQISEISNDLDIGEMKAVFSFVVVQETDGDHLETRILPQLLDDHLSGGSRSRDQHPPIVDASAHVEAAETAHARQKPRCSENAETQKRVRKENRERNPGGRQSGPGK